MQLLLDGLKLMVVGTGMVFLFLCIMILWILISSKLSARFEHLFPVEANIPAPPRRARPTPPAADDQGRLVAVISAAIRMYRNDHPGN